MGLEQSKEAVGVLRRLLFDLYSGRRERARTVDLCRVEATLYQLSYAPIWDANLTPSGTGGANGFRRKFFRPAVTKRDRYFVFKPAITFDVRVVMNKLMPLFLTLAIMLSPVRRAALAQQQLTDPGVEKIKIDIARRVRDGKKQMSPSNCGTARSEGRITQAADMFTLREKNSRSQLDISYADVTKVKSKGVNPFKNGVLR